MKNIGTHHGNPQIITQAEILMDEKKPSNVNRLEPLNLWPR